MRLKRSIQFYVYVFMMFAVACFAKEEVAKASDTVVSLTPDTVYQYDVNEDGVTDQVEVKIVRNEDREYSGEVKVCVNEEIVFEQKRKCILIYIARFPVTMLVYINFIAGRKAN